MNKRTFLKTSSVLIGGSLVFPFSACESPSKESSVESTTEHLKNWAANLEYSAQKVYYPKSLEEVQEVVKTSEFVKPLGSQHSFNRIADTDKIQLSMKHLNKVVSLDKAADTVTVEGGTRYGEFAEYLEKNGYALPNLASLPHITVAGACATATHGSGVKNGNLSTAVSAIEFVNAAGDVVTLSKQKDGEEFYGSVVNLGALGVITKVTLDLLPTFEMKQMVYRNLPIEELKGHFDDIQSKGYSVSLFTNWQNKNISEVWIKNRVEKGTITPEDLDLYGAKAATQNMHPVEDQSAETVTEQMGKPGPWYERMPHFKMGFTPSTGKELQSEYFVPIEHAFDAIMAIEKLHEKISPHLFISEIRTINADNFWMSPCYKKTCVAIHTTWKQEVETVMGLLPIFEELLAPFNPVPHWAKLFTIPPATLRSRYSRLNDFKQLVEKHDPKGKFMNDFLSKNLFA